MTPFGRNRRIQGANRNEIIFQFRGLISARDHRRAARLSRKSQDNERAGCTPPCLLAASVRPSESKLRPRFSFNHGSSSLQEVPLPPNPQSYSENTSQKFEEPITVFVRGDAGAISIVLESFCEDIEVCLEVFSDSVFLQNINNTKVVQLTLATV